MDSLFRSRIWLLTAAVTIAMHGRGPAYAQTSQGSKTLDAAVVRELDAAGARTQARLKVGGARFRIVFTLPNGVEGTVDVVRFQGAMKWEFSIRAEGKRHVMAAFIERDGNWYLTEPGIKPARYRPFEAPFQLPIVYALLLKSEIAFVGDIDTSQLTVVSLDDTKIAGLIPLEGEARAQVELALAASRALGDAAREKKPDEARRKQIEQLEALRKGTTVEIDRVNGLLSGMGGGTLAWRRTAWEWLHEAPAELNVDRPADYADCSSEIPESELESYILISHAGIWRKGMPSMDVDGCVMNVRTGAIRRVAHRGPMATPWGFSRDRKRIYFSGMQFGEVGMQPMEIELRSGERRNIGKAVTEPKLFMGTLSNNAERAAVTGIMTPTGNVRDALRFPLIEIDLRSGVTRSIGTPRDWKICDWFADDSALLVEDREYVSDDKPAISKICRVSLDGARTSIVMGRDGRVLRKMQRILFQNTDDMRWYTCDFGGGDVRAFCDGLPQLGQPGVSPNEREAIFIKYDGPAGPMPVLVDLESESVSPIAVRAGLWAFPIWR